MEEKHWYVIHTYSGYENKVKTDLEKRIESMNMEDKIFRIMVPTEDVVETNDKKKSKVVKRKVFPGYVLVEMIMTDDSWYVVRNTTGVTGFVGTGAKPVPLYDDEAKALLRQMGQDELAEGKFDCEIGDTVEILDSSFRGLEGQVSAIDNEKKKVTVMVSLFGRETPVEIDFNQVIRI